MKKIMNLANKLTIFRIILVPVLVIIPFFDIKGNILNIPISMWIMNLIFIIASITDKLDGTIARKRNEITTFGKFLDPIADKILVLAAMIVLVEMKVIPAWIPIITLFREFVVSGYRLVAVEKGGNVISASIWGKLKTVTQMIAIILAFLDISYYGAIFSKDLSGYQFIINLLMTIFMTVSVIATIFSGYDYIKNGKDILK